VLTKTQLTRIYEQRRNYDLRRLLAGAERLLDSLLDLTEREPAFLLGAIRCLPLASTVRDQISNTISSACGKIKVNETQSFITLFANIWLQFSEFGFCYSSCQQSTYHISSDEEIRHPPSRPSSYFQSSELLRVLQDSRKLDSHLPSQIWCKVIRKQRYSKLVTKFDFISAATCMVMYPIYLMTARLASSCLRLTEMLSSFCLKRSKKFQRWDFTLELKVFPATLIMPRAYVIIISSWKQISLQVAGCYLQLSQRELANKTLKVLVR